VFFFFSFLLILIIYFLLGLYYILVDKMANENDLVSGPQPGVSYPLKVIYCGECSLPCEYCENGPTAEKCKEWMKKNLPDLFAQLNPPSADGSANDGASGEEKKPQKRGGKGLQKVVKKETVDKKISISRAPRGKK